jgi:hypothetical protein
MNIQTELTPETANQRIAVFQATDCNYNTIFTDSMENASSYVRISEYLDVTFAPRAKEEVNMAVIADLDLEASKIRRQAIKRLEEIAQMKAEILCLPCVEAVNLSTKEGIFYD